VKIRTKLTILSTLHVLALFLIGVAFLHRAIGEGDALKTRAEIEAVEAIASALACLVSAFTLLFIFVVRPLTKRLAELSAGAKKAAKDRTFRFPSIANEEFAATYAAFNEMLGTMVEQETRRVESAKLDGWREIASLHAQQLKAPLASMSLAGENIADAVESEDGMRVPDPERTFIKHRCETIRDESARVRALFERLKRFSDSAAGETTVFRAMDLIASSAARFPAERARFEFKGALEAPIRADSGLCGEALAHVFSNAVEACAAPPVSLYAEAKSRGRVVELIIRDGNGPADTASIEKAGRVRFTTKPSGTGLGLLFVKRAIVIQGGAFAVEAGPDGSFQIRISLPYASGA